MFAHHHLGGRAIDKPIVDAAASPAGGAVCDDRWQISVTAAKVTPPGGLCGPTGGCGAALVSARFTATLTFRG